MSFRCFSSFYFRISLDEIYPFLGKFLKEMEDFDPKFLAEAQLDWELMARGIKWPASVEKARDILQNAIIDGVPLFPIEGDSAQIRDETLEIIKQFRAQLGEGEAFYAKSAEISTIFQHIENKMRYTSDPRDPKNALLGSALTELKKVRYQFKEQLKKHVASGKISGATAGPLTPTQNPKRSKSPKKSLFSNIYVQEGGKAPPLESTIPVLSAASEPFVPRNLDFPHLESSQDRRQTFGIPNTGSTVPQSMNRSQFVTVEQFNAQSAQIKGLESILKNINDSLEQLKLAQSGRRSRSSSRSNSDDAVQFVGTQPPNLPRSNPFPTPAPRRLKPLQLKDWGVSFSGDRKGKKAKIFLRDVERMAMIQGVSLQEVVWSMRLLLTDGAQTWYDSFSEYLLSCSWEEFREKFLSAFCNLESDFAIRKKIEDRKQGVGENAEVFLASMLSLFEELDEEISESEKVRLIRRNLHYSLSNALLLYDIPTIAELSMKLKLIERNRSYAFLDRPKTARFNAVGSQGSSSDHTGSGGRTSDQDGHSGGTSSSTSVNSSHSGRGGGRNSSSRGNGRRGGRNANASSTSNRNHQDQGGGSNPPNGAGSGSQSNNTNSQSVKKPCVYCKNNSHNVRSCPTRPKYICFKCGKVGTIYGLCPVCNPQGEPPATQ